MIEHVADLKLRQIERMERSAMIAYLNRFMPVQVRIERLQGLSLEQLRTTLIEVRRIYHRQGN